VSNIQTSKAIHLFNSNMVNSILIGVPGNYSNYKTICLKKSIHLIIQDEAMRINLVTILQKQQDKMEKGHQILNTNIPKELLPILKG